MDAVWWFEVADDDGFPAAVEVRDQGTLLGLRPAYPAGAGLQA